MIHIVYSIRFWNGLFIIAEINFMYYFCLDFKMLLSWGYFVQIEKGNVFKKGIYMPIIKVLPPTVEMSLPVFKLFFKISQIVVVKDK